MSEDKFNVDVKIDHKTDGREYMHKQIGNFVGLTTSLVKVAVGLFITFCLFVLIVIAFSGCGGDHNASCSEAIVGMYDANCKFTKNGIEISATDMIRECEDVKIKYPECLVKHNIYLNCLSRTVRGMKCETRCLAEKIAFEGCYEFTSYNRTEKEM